MAFCTECGHQVDAGAPACTSCGAPMQGAPPPPQQQWQAPPPTVTPAGYGGYAAAPPPAPQWQGQPQWQAPAPGYPPQQQPAPAYPPPQQQWQAPGAPAYAGVADLRARSGAVLDRLLDDIRSFSLKWVVPFDAALSPQMVKNRSIWVTLFFGFFPLAILMLGLVKEPNQLLFCLTTYFCLAWAGYFFYFVCKRSTNLLVGVGVMAFTTFIGIPIVLNVQTFPGFSHLYALTADDKDLISNIFGFVLGVGVVEEGAKCIPVLIAAYALKKIEKPLDGIFLGAMSGLGFAIAEGVMYIGGQKEGLGIIVQQMIRTTTLPFLHALWSACVGYFIALSLINRSRALALVLLGLAVGVVHHGLYDALAGKIPIVGLVWAGFLFLLFAAYLERAQNMVAELKQAEAVAAEQSMREQVWNQYVSASGQFPAVPVAPGAPAPGQWPAAPPPPPYNPPPGPTG